MNWVVVTTSPSGFNTHVGPFGDREVAYRWAEAQPNDYLITQLWPMSAFENVR